MSAAPFDKKLAELDAYLQMLISENESLDQKLTNYRRASNTTINNYDGEVEGIINIKSNLEKLLSSIKHSIVLLQIAKVSSRASFSSTTGDFRPNPPQATPSPPARSKFRALKSTSFSASPSSSATSKSDTNSRGKRANQTQVDNIKKLDNSSSSSFSFVVLGGAHHGNNNLPQEEEQQQRQELERRLQSEQEQQQANPNTATLARQSSSSAVASPGEPSSRQGSLSHQIPPPPPRSSQIHVDTTMPLKSSPPQLVTAGTAEILRDCDANGGRKGYGATTTNIDSDGGVNSNGAHATHTTPSSSLRIHDSNVVGDDDGGDGDNDNDDDDDDDDPFFDAADVQLNQFKTISDVDTPKTKAYSSSSIQVNHPTASPLTSAISTKLTANNRTIIMPPQAQGSDNMAETNNNIDGQVGNESIDWDAFYEEEDDEELGSMEGQGSVIKHLLSQIRIGMDLTKVVLPTFILERRSLLEMYADFFAHPDLFSAIPDFKSPEERMIQLVRWYLSAFHAGRKSSLAKKPYNPILGEIFKCQWLLEGPSNETINKRRGVERTGHDDANVKESNDNEDAKQQLTFVAEQVSHHPPVSAFYAENKEKRISCCAHIYTKSKYLGLSVGVHNIGKGVISLLEHNETYVCTFPSAYGRSILTVPWIELGGPVTIHCEQTGYKANIEFLMKPFYGGRKHRVTGEILRPNNEPILTIDGEWNGVMYSKSPPSSSSKQVFVDTTNLSVIKKHVKPVTVQDSFESRNVWKEVTRALKLKDVNNATAAKSFIEQRQRDLLKDRLEKGIKWRTRYFEHIDDGWQYVANKAKSSDAEEVNKN